MINLKYLLIILLMAISSRGQKSVKIDFGNDLASRYVWRGFDINNTPSIQPSITSSFPGLALGFWGSYYLSNQRSKSNEIDGWLSYIFNTESGSLTAVVTDYYFPNTVINIGNFNNYDDPEGPGAHLFEFGLSFQGNNNFPISVSGYLNVYNEEGKNSYFEIGYSTSPENISLDFFCGNNIGQ